MKAFCFFERGDRLFSFHGVGSGFVETCEGEMEFDTVFFLKWEEVVLAGKR